MRHIIKRQYKQEINPLSACHLLLVSLFCFSLEAHCALTVAHNEANHARQYSATGSFDNAPTRNVFQRQYANNNADNRQTATVVNDSKQKSDSRLNADHQANNIETNALNYLQRYGYMSQPSDHEASNNLISEESFSSAIKDFQRFAGLPATGLADDETMELMQLPRCGNSDKWRPPVPFVGHQQQIQNQQAAQVHKIGQLSRQFKLVNVTNGNSLSRKRRYALQGSKWRRQELTYRISQYPTRFNGKRHEVDEQIAKAFGIWSHVAPIDFVVKRDGRVHIDIRFASGDHGDGDAFDGPGNTLAHAYFPQYGGDAHFDDQEYWTIDSYAGTNIFQVAAHELGHSLGLGHSNVREALMAPFYQKYKPNFKLHIDDILAIQALYGEKPVSFEHPSSSSSSSTSSFGFVSPSTTTTSTIMPTTTSTTTIRPKSSSDTTLASGTRQGGRFPFYKGRRPDTTTTTTTTSLGPFDNPDEQMPNTNSSGGDGHETSDDENELAHPDSSNDGGSGTVAGDGEPTIFDSPSSYPADLCSQPAVDAITRTEDGSSYVFKGDYYWLLAQDGLAKGYPRRISQDWEGLPGNLDAALTWADGKTFFFKDNKYWRFRNKRRDVGYPKLISSGFAGIPNNIDAAFVWSGNGRTYFFKGTEYWRFDSKADPPVSDEYPRLIKVWLGVPSYINAAFKWENNVTYFFKGNHYYRFNDREFKVEPRGRPPFPRATAEWWFGCTSSNSAQRALPGSLASFVNSEISSTLSTRESKHHQQHHQQQQQQTVTEAGDWAFLAGLEDNSRSMGTHISDHSRPPVLPGQAKPSTVAAEGPIMNLPGTQDNDQQQVITVDGPSGILATSARQPRQHNGRPISRPRGGDMGTTLFSSTTTSNGSGLKFGAHSSASSASSPMPNALFSSFYIISTAILITARSKLFKTHLV